MVNKNEINEIKNLENRLFANFPLDENELLTLKNFYLWLAKWTAKDSESVKAKKLIKLINRKLAKQWKLDFIASLTIF